MIPVVFISTVEKRDVWVPVLEHLAPHLDIRVWPDTGPAEQVEYAIVAQPPAGELAKYPNLKAVLSLWAGINAMLADPDLPEVPIYRMIEPSLTRGMVEYVTHHVLGCHIRADTYRNREWQHPLHLNGRTADQTRVGILGLGELGRACADMLVHVGFRVHGFSTRPKDIPGVESFTGDEGLRRCLGQSDVLVCLLPMTADTDGFLDYDTLGLLPRGAFVINAARGEHVIDADLIARIDEGHIEGAVLDVFREEPLPPDHPFWTHEKIVVTPHIASVTVAQTAVPVLIDKIARLERGETVEGLVDRERGY